MSAVYVQYGCGLDAPEGWVNFDASPTLRLQRIPIVRGIRLPGFAQFPANARFGDIVRGLPVPEGACAAMFCSHVLEHLSRQDAEVALRNTWRYLRPGGVFRLVVPDLRQLAAKYMADPSSQAAHDFMRDAHLGRERRPRGLRGVLAALLGNSAHLWMWDEPAMREALEAAGFVNIRRCEFGDSPDENFRLVENAHRFAGSLALECRKP